MAQLFAVFVDEGQKVGARSRSKLHLMNASGGAEVAVPKVPVNRRGGISMSRREDRASPLPVELSWYEEASIGSWMHHRKRRRAASRAFLSAVLSPRRQWAVAWVPLGVEPLHRWRQNEAALRYDGVGARTAGVDTVPAALIAVDDSAVVAGFCPEG